MTRHAKIRLLMERAGVDPDDARILIRDGSSGHSVPDSYEKKADLEVDGKTVGIYQPKPAPVPPPVVVKAPPKAATQPPVKKGFFK